MCRVLKTRTFECTRATTLLCYQRFHDADFSLSPFFSLFLTLPLCCLPFYIALSPLPLPSLSHSLFVPCRGKWDYIFIGETTFAHYEVLRAKPRRPAEWRSRELTLNITRTSREPSVRTIFILSLCFSLFFSFFCLPLSSSLSCARMSVRSGAKISDIPLTFDVTTTMK